MSVEVEGFDIEIQNKETSIKPCKKSSKKSGGFQSFGLSYPVLRGIKTRGYKVPTPIQRKCIPLILSGRDVVAMARTGSGKTACFLLPLFEKLSKPHTKTSSGPRALILSPTRELALQTLKFIKELGRFTNLKPITVLGGDSMDYQFGAIHENPDIVVATPGRFLHVCLEMDLKLNSVEYVVLDEADRLFELGLGEQLKEILFRLPENRQTLLFSATLPKLLVNFAKAGLCNPVLLRLNVEKKLPSTLELYFLSIRADERNAALLCLLGALPRNKQTLVFTATKHHVDYLHSLLDLAGISNTFLYSDLAPAARKINIAKFQEGSCSVLVVTDVAARGVDIPQLDYVINYHFPSKAKLFVHRVGRCARAGRSGIAFSFISKSEAPYYFDLLKFLNRPVNIVPPNCTESFIKDNALGKIPENLLESEQSRIIMWHQNNFELDSMRKVYENGYKKYLQSNPGATKEALKNSKNVDLNIIGVHPFFNCKEDEVGLEVADFLSKMKTYKPRGTIFELKSSMNQKCYEVMKKTKKAHANYLHRKTEASNAELHDECDSENREGSTLNGKSERKRKINARDSMKMNEKKKRIDNEYYVPHFAPDQDTENGLNINNFLSDANKATFDMIGDCDEDLNIQKRIRKWDKEKKKYVTLGNREKTGKIKTECGKWIAASYKTGRYDKWKERSKVEEREDSDDESGALKRKDFPNTHWGRHNRKISERVKLKSGLKRPEQILKARLELDKKRQKSIPKSKRKNLGSGTKNKFKKNK